MTHGRAFVDYRDPVRLEVLDVLLRVMTRGLDDPDAALNDGTAILRVRWRSHGRQNGEIDREWPAGQRAAALDLAPQLIRRGLSESGQDAERARVGDGRRQPGAAHPHHAALDDGVFDADQLCESSLQAECVSR